jgi:prepilin-type N-terminal cleavage/methylation domain-containing protein
MHRPSYARQSGFTLIEIMVTLVVFAIVVGTTQRAETVQGARAALDLIARDIRSAGYGADAEFVGMPQPSIAYVDSTELIMSENQFPVVDTLTAGPQSPQAYDPAGAPRPATLNGTAWQPPGKYTTGAELIRYTLDVNNDGFVNAGDIASAQGVDAASTPNPNDYVLVREVYGDRTFGVVGNNGGAQERVALLAKPGGSVPPLYTVYMRGNSTPWNWNNGPVPVTQLNDIERVELKVTATSARPDAKGTYATTTLATQVSATRSKPDWGAATTQVSGFVYEDKEPNGAMDGLDVGLAGVTVRLGNYVGYTSAGGFYSIRAANGTYALRHTPPTGYGVFTNPDSFVVTVAGASVTRSFADTARMGGWVTMQVYEDQNGNRMQDTGEPPLSGINFVVSPGGATAYSDAYGTARVFAQAGGYSVTTTVPDSMTATTASAFSGTMTNGGTASYTVGLRRGVNGYVSGRVFRDNNRNGVADATDAGLSNVWVGITTNGGVTVQGYSFTDASGNYNITVPANDPPHTQAYTIFMTPPAGFYPTTTTAIPNVWVLGGATLPNQNFGMASYQIITLNASRVLSLAARDLIEADWNGSHTENARADADLVLGADAGGTDNVSVWFNNYASTPLFTPSASYSRNAPQSVMAMSLDTLDRNDPVSRPDLVSGTRRSALGNFFVWLNQNSNNNEGFFPSAYSPGLAYTTSDAGDVQAVKTMDCAGGASPDIIVGTKSPTLNTGTFEVWQSNDATNPTFTRQETYPTAGLIPGNTMGEVTAMALADFDGDGDRDLVVGTKTGVTSGDVMFFEYVSKANGLRFIHRKTINITSGFVTALAVTDLDQDGNRDVIVGTQLNTSRGKLIWLRNKDNVVNWSFANRREVDALGIVQSLSTTDLGGGSAPDLIVGWRATDTGYGGGVTVYYLDVMTIPNAGVDPSNGEIVNMVPASAVANFNFGANTTPPPTPYLGDFAVGVKASATTGALVVFIR